LLGKEIWPVFDCILAEDYAIIDEWSIGYGGLLQQVLVIENRGELRSYVHVNG
jgi:hypothetical protein